MDKRVLNELKILCSGLYNLKPHVKAVWVYGSAVKKTNVKGSDIDILILADDTVEDLNISSIEAFTKVIEATAEKQGLKLHFQSPKKLTLWWNLVRTGEPWTITSLRDSIILYDPSGYVTLLKKLLQKGELYVTEQRAEKLIENAKRDIAEARQISLEKIPFEILMVMTEAAQMALMYYGKFPPAPRHVAYELRNVFVKEKLLEEDIVEDFEDIFETVEKIHRGTLSEVTGRDIDSSVKKAKEFINVMEELMLKLEHRKRESGMEDIYKACMALCEQALKKKLKNLPKSDAEKINLFKKEFIDTKIIGLSHFKTLDDLHKYHTSKKRRKTLEKEKYLDGTYIRSLRIAMKDVL